MTSTDIKVKIRQRMAKTGEKYNVARREQELARNVEQMPPHPATSCRTIMTSASMAAWLWPGAPASLDSDRDQVGQAKSDDRDLDVSSSSSQTAGHGHRVEFWSGAEPEWACHLPWLIA
jgi:hypothetical protein